MAKRDYYETLGVGRTADEKEIKRAYRKLAKKYHPDTNQDDKQAEQKFKEVTEAYDVLGNPEKKKLYDQYGMAAFDGSMANGADPGNPFARGRYASGFGNNGQYTEYHFSSDDMDDIFGDIFGRMFGGRGAGNNFRSGFQRGFGNSAREERQEQNLYANIDITLEEAALGSEKILRLEGTRSEKLQVHIPAGINEGQSIRLKGKGRPGWRNSPAGDLFIKVHILENSLYKRKDLDVYTSISIPRQTAVSGGETYVHTLYGTVKCKIPAGIRQGGKIRLRNKGIVSMKNPNIHGDEYVTVQIHA